MEEYKISILTVTYNHGHYIEQNIKSVLDQNYKNVEHIIIDGGSTDNTIEILKKHPQLKWISEKDDGQCDALNKGLEMATGEIIGWLNSDDYYVENIFHKINMFFQTKSCDWLIGDSFNFYEQHNAKEYISSAPITYDALLKDTKIVRQPPTFFRKSLLEITGFVRKEFHYENDYELWLRLSTQSIPLMVNEPFAVFRIHAAQKTSALNRLKYIKEARYLLKREGVSWLKSQITLYPHYKTLVQARLKIILIKLRLMDKKYANIPYSTKKLSL